MGVPIKMVRILEKQVQQMQQTIERLEAQASANNMQMQMQSQSRASSSSSSSRKSSSDDMRQMSTDDKVALSEAIGQLPNEKLSRIVEIIKERMPYLKNENGDEIEVDINALDAPTLRHLQRYV